jgi:hypothetical protein
MAVARTTVFAVSIQAVVLIIVLIVIKRMKRVLQSWRVINQRKTV